MEITLNRQSFKKALGVFLVVALFFGMCSPAAPYLPKISFDVGAANVTDGNVTDGNIIESGSYGNQFSYTLRDNGRLVISGNGVIYYGYWNFDVSFVKSIVIEEGITSIGYAAFSYFDNLRSIEIPDSVKSIGTSAFAYCRRLESINIPYGVEYISDCTFLECDYLKNITIPDSVKVIGDNAFFSCNRLENIVLPEGAEKIGYYAFFNCDSFTDITLPESVALIEESAFRGCNNMASIKMGGESVQDLEIRKDAFYNCLSLESVTILHDPEWYCDISDECGIREEAIFYGYEDSNIKWFAYENSSRFRVYCPHEDTEAVDALAFSCYSDGHEEGIRCNDCGRWVTGGEGILASHLDENADKICDRCAKAMPKWENFVGGNMETVNNRKYCDDKARVYSYDDGTLEVFGEGTIVAGRYGGGGGYLGYYGGVFLSTKKLIIHEGITEIDEDCFKKFLYIEEVILPSTLTNVHSGAFADCVRLSKIVVLNPTCGFSSDGTSTPKHTVIYGYSDSAAEDHAKHWMIKFVPLDREHDHEFESKLTLKPTCSATGTEEYTCYCGESYTEVVPANSHFDINKDDNCDMCGVKLNAFDQPVKPDEDEDGGTTEAPEGDSGSAQEPEEEKNVFEKFFESLIEFFKNFANLFDYFKNMF